MFPPKSFTNVNGPRELTISKVVFKIALISIYIRTVYLCKTVHGSNSTILALVTLDNQSQIGYFMGKLKLHDETWTKFSNLGVGMLVNAVQLHSLQIQPNLNLKTNVFREIS
jgi:hypothetical protein